MHADTEAALREQVVNLIASRTELTAEIQGKLGQDIFRPEAIGNVILLDEEAHARCVAARPTITASRSTVVSILVSDFFKQSYTPPIRCPRRYDRMKTAMAQNTSLIPSRLRGLRLAVAT